MGENGVHDMLATEQNTGGRQQQKRDSSALFGKIQLFLEDKSWQKILEIESAKGRWISTQVNALGGNCHASQKPLKNLHV